MGGVNFRQKKPAHLRRSVQERSTNSYLKILTNQYLWDNQSINQIDESSSDHSQQLIAKCN